MVRTCCVYKCSNRGDAKGKANGLSFFRFPKELHKRRLWIRAINRRNFVPNEHTCICSEHFVTGWHSYDKDDINYVPTLFSYKETSEDRRRQGRVSRRDMHKEFLMQEKKEQDFKERSLSFSLMSHSYCKAEAVDEDVTDAVIQSTDLQCDDVDCGTTFNSFGTQTDPDPLLLENQMLKAELEKMRTELGHHKRSVAKIKKTMTK